jgi:hypothetical protein
MQIFACIVSAFLLFTPTLAAQPRKPKPKPPAPAPAPAANPAIPITVVEIAGTQAYIQPGSSGGLRRNAKVIINRKEYVVVQTTASYAVIDVGTTPVREQDTGRAVVGSGDDEDKPAELAKPRPLATWEHAWTDLQSPASTQPPPQYVPLGSADRDRRYDIRLMIAGGSIIPLQRGAGIARAELNARVHAEPFATPMPLAFDLDMSVQRWFAEDLSSRFGSGARPVVWVRELLVGYGAAAPGATGWYAGLGRMRYAASTLGTLDGTRVRAPLGAGFAVGSFGGVLPNPLSGEPSFVAQRFGVEASYNRPDVDLRPEAALVVNGSTFRGDLDERRITGTFGLYPGLTRVGGHFELSNFPSNNPWKASPVELTAGGVDASVRAGIFRFGGRFDARQPVRSLWLASFLPNTWFCRTVPVPAPTAPEQCDGSVSTRAFATVDAGVELGNVALTVGGTTVDDLTQKDSPDMRGGFATARVVRIARILRLEASGNYSRATYLDMYGGSIGPGVSLFHDVVDLFVYFRNATIDYRSVDVKVAQNGVGSMVMLLPSPELLFTVQGEGIVGGDANALLLFGTAMWRPRLR